MRKISKFLAVIAISIMAVCVPAQASEITPEVTAAPTVTAVPVQPTAAPARKKGLVKPFTKTVTILTRTERRLQVGKELVNTYMYLIWKAN